jgi:hypothetical protein
MQMVKEKLAKELLAHFKLRSTYFNLVFVGLTMWVVNARIRGKGEVEFFGSSLNVETIYWIQGIMVVIGVTFLLIQRRKDRHTSKVKSVELK